LAEHYSGSDSDGSWTEGDPRPEVSLSSIPGGKYDLIVTLSAHRWNGGSSSSSFSMPTGFAGSSMFGQDGGQTTPVTVTIKRGGVFGGNILLAFLLIAIWPLIVLFKQFGFEKRRMAPVSGSGGSDDDDSGGDDD